MSKLAKDATLASDDEAKEHDKNSTEYVQERFDPKKTPKNEVTSEAKTKPKKSKIGDDEEEEESSTESDGGAQDTPLSEEKLKAAMVVEGMEQEIKQLYLGKEGVDGAEHEWVDRMPMAMSMKASAMSAKERERSKFIALVRMELRPRARFTDDNPVQIHSLVVQSPLLRKVLERVFEDHPDMNAAQNKLSFEKPLEPFVHRWSNLLQAVEEEKDVETKEHLDLLLDAIKPELEGTLATRDMCIAHDAITFEQLWMIFEPGALVISVTDKTECAYKIVKPEIRKNNRGCWFVMECVCADWDGETYGKASVVLAITIFSGSQKISQLDVIPLNLHPNKERLTKTLLERGKRFTELADVKYMVYRGTAIDRSHPSEPRKLYVDGRIVIDSDGYIRFNPGEDVMITPFKASQGSLEEPDYWKRYRQDRFFSQYDKKDTSDRAELTDEQLIMCRHLVRGFSLKLKRWLDFQIEGVTDVVWNDRAFDRLILPGDHKNLLLAFAKGQRDSDDHFDDIIEGKGKGMIIQLSGPPGVGKTLTAEAVAETMRVPLYTISAGDLGVRPDVVQSHLSNAFQLARNWSAVLLLDEADVFMEKRSTNDLERNQLVSLFLQSLEYYQGTLFLTTNRVETFDPAFESRVHIAMRFDELSTDSRREIWKTFLGVQPKSGEAKSDITEEEIEEFVGMTMNGRQIKNVVKSASLLALSEKGCLRAEHVQTVLRIKKAERE